MTPARDLFAVIGDGPEPPLRGSDEVLDRARRAARRRSRRQALACASALVVLVVGVVAAMPRRTGPGIPAAPAAPVVSVTPPPAVPTVPSARSAHAHADSVDQILMDAVPAGYGAEPAALTGAGTDHGPVSFAWMVDIAKGRFREASLVRVTRGDGVGMLMAVVGSDGPDARAVPGPCAVALDLGIEGAVDLTCDQVVVGGVPVRVVTGRDPRLGTVEAAIRFIRGGYVEVVFSQGVRAYRSVRTGTGSTWEVAVNPGHEPPLAAVPISALGVAQLAADPDLLP